MEYEAFVPTPPQLIEAKLDFAELKPGDTVYDLGCGDAGVLVRAAQNYDVRGVGIEVQAELVAMAQAAVASNHLEDRIEIRQQDYDDADLAEADVVILFLTRGSLGKVSLKLEEELRPGTRIVTHLFDLPGWSAEQQTTLRLPDGSEATLYRYCA